MRHGDHRQALVTGIAKDPVGTLHELLGGQTRQCAVPGIGLRQQAHVRARVGTRKAGARGAVPLDEDERAALGAPLNQPGELLARIAADPFQETEHHTLVGPPQAAVAKAL